MSLPLPSQLQRPQLLLVLSEEEPLDPAALGIWLLPLIVQMDRKYLLERLIEASTFLGVETHRLALVGGEWVWQAIV